MNGWLARRLWLIAIAGIVACSTAPGSTSSGVSSAVNVSISFDADFYTVAAGAEGVWLLSPTGKVARIDPIVGAIADMVDVPASEFGNIAAGAGSIWVTSFDHDALLRIDPATKRVANTISVGRNPEGLVVTDDFVFVSNHRGGSISKVDVATNTVVATFAFVNPGPSGPKDIAIVDGDLWTTVPRQETVYRLDPETGEVVAKLPLDGDLDSPLTDGRYVYVRLGEDTMEKIDPSKDAAVPDFAPEILPIAFGLDAFWSWSGRDFLRLDPGTLETTGTWTVMADPSPPTGIAFNERSIWIVLDSHAVIRFEPDD